MPTTQVQTTTAKTEREAKSLSMFLYGRVTFNCEARIEQGEEECSAWIRRLRKKYFLTNI